MRKVVPFEEQRFSRSLRKGISEAVAAVQLRWVSAAFAEIPVSFPRNSCLRFRDRLDQDLGLPE